MFWRGIQGGGFLEGLLSRVDVGGGRGGGARFLGGKQPSGWKPNHQQQRLLHQSSQTSLPPLPSPSLPPLLRLLLSVGGSLFPTSLISRSSVGGEKNAISAGGLRGVGPGNEEERASGVGLWMRSAIVTIPLYQPNGPRP